jgi:hypothetical protein
MLQEHRLRKTLEIIKKNWAGFNYISKIEGLAGNMLGNNVYQF